MLEKNIYNAYGFVMKFSNYDSAISNLIKGVDLDVSAGGKILDVACGTGVVGLALMGKSLDSVLLSTDINDRLLYRVFENAKKLGIDKSRVSVGYSDITSPEVVVGGGVELFEGGEF